LLTQPQSHCGLDLGTMPASGAFLLIIVAFLADLSVSRIDAPREERGASK
jgi:uncharacterized membrane-anchored protein